ncbi:MAGUK p55 subfamily member 2 isoform X4 [Folsomia candida]|uniref:MAGUK p55 subfamily member 2 isoform X4 n=1 Tax=Folsomia candida TaxID=158441 RepID=UPI0016051BAF|nr:MAGUK p55 subfamily member 2 isoform X4 [Folsomia candida]
MCQLVKCVEFEIPSYVARIVRLDLPVSFTLPNGQECDQGRMVYSNNNGHGYQRFTGQTAFETVRNHIASLNQQNTDLIFLKSLIESPIVSNLVKVQDQLEEDLAPVGSGNVPLTQEICQRYDRSFRQEAKELSDILRDRNFKALLEAHDKIADKLGPQEGTSRSLTEAAPWEEIRPAGSILKPTKDKSNMSVDSEDSNVQYAQPIRIISLRKSPSQPLGVTVEEDKDTKNLVVARILSGGLIDRLGLLKLGDVILEVNSKPVISPEGLQAEIAKARDNLQLKVGSPTQDKTVLSGRQCFMRALFTYNPALDTLQPCKEIGLGFQTGDILQIVDQSDPNWWQSKKVGENVVGLIPSRELEERRAAFVPPEADISHTIGICGTRVARKKKNIAYTAKQNAEFDRAELMLYEEVTRMPPFRRKTLVIVGTSGVARRTLKNRLVNWDPHRFGAVLPTTSRPPREGEEQMGTYNFLSREEFEEGIRTNKYLEFAEKDGNLYGINADSVREIIRQGKMCIIDCNPTVLKILHNSPEFMPYVVFLAARGGGDIQQQDAFNRQHGYSSRTLNFDRMSSIRYSSRRARTLESIASLYEDDDARNSVEESQRLQQLYAPYYDLVVVNEDFDTTFRRVAQSLDSLSTDHQWVPVTWVY